MPPTKTRNVTIGLVQMRCTPDPDANLAAAINHVRDAAAKGARIVCLPELFRSLYFCQTEDHDNFNLAEPIPGPSTEKLGQLARELGIAIVASLFEHRAAGIYHNTVAVVGPEGDLLGKYRKMHIPDDPLFYEKFYFTPGDTGFAVFNTQKTQLGTLICWDQWYPEAARITALMGAEIIFYPTAIGWHPSEKSEFGKRQHSSWELIQRSHAVANGCYVAAINRIGREPDPTQPENADSGIEFWGQTFIADPSGEIIARASTDKEEILIVDLDLDAIATQRQHWPFFRDRRIDAYDNILRRYVAE